MTRYSNYNLSDPVSVVQAHLPQVRLMANRLAAKLPPWVEVNDLVGAGVLGLLDALDKYDSNQGVMLRVYAESRVRGAILNRLRDIDWAPSSSRHTKRVETVPETTGEHLGGAQLSHAAFQRLLHDLTGLTTTGRRQDEDDSSAVATQMPADPASNPLATYESPETQEYVMESIDRLSKQEREIIVRYYVDELTMNVIGAILGVTESRVSQVHAQLMRRLRTALAAKRLTLAFSS